MTKGAKSPAIRGKRLHEPLSSKTFLQHTFFFAYRILPPGTTEENRHLTLHEPSQQLFKPVNAAFPTLYKFRWDSYAGFRGPNSGYPPAG